MRVFAGSAASDGFTVGSFGGPSLDREYCKAMTWAGRAAASGTSSR